MPFSPNISQVSYLQGGADAPFSVVQTLTNFRRGTVTRIMAPTVTIPFAGISQKSNVLNVVTTDIDNSPGAEGRTYEISINKSLADQLAPGRYVDGFSVFYYINGSSSNSSIRENCIVLLEIFENVIIEASPTNLSWPYVIGSSQPLPKIVSITSDKAWTVTKNQSWITLDKSQGVNNDTLQVGVNVTGLAVGTYTGRVEIDDGQSSEVIDVSLIVKNVDDTNDYLTISPSTRQHQTDEGVSGVIASSVFEVSTSQDVTIASDAPWITPINTNLSAGDSIGVIYRVENTENLTPGTYEGNVIITSNYSVVVGRVTLFIIDSNVTGISDGDFIFSEDYENIILTTNQTDVEMLLRFSTNNGIENRSYQKRAPFFQGVAKSHIGAEAVRLLQIQNVLPPNSLATVFSPLSPLKMAITVFEKQKNSTQQSIKETFNQIKVISGKKPSNAFALNYMPTISYAQVNSKVGFSFRASTVPSTLTMLGAINESISVSGLDGDLFSCFVDLSHYSPDISQQLRLSCGGFVHTINLRPRQANNTLLVFLNEWNLPEYFNCYGFLEEIPEGDQSTTTYLRKGVLRKEVVETYHPKSYRLSTGFVYTKEEAVWLSKILDAKRVWIEIDGELVEVIRTFQKLSIAETRRFYNSYSLTFETAEK
ncbi:hypothetical protein L0P88_03930 [Muricauda sp. SCSIO 64092]|uniref:hypothetical protein n=1 Tax=Allomuricauda sp. SCSIO 64092 TaxID=2908842 RepID=UPI001FF18A92|nr:hypothetical protein [Muricauda sp. SCSIO 64092]UOY07703.1 hypothetical protein L0P88_03930 [Muricauda sp. SCSIO 64092]